MTHYYDTPAGRFPSVTTVLQATKSPKDVAGLDAWRARVGDEEAKRISRAAIQRGQDLHQAIEWSLVENRAAPDMRELGGVSDLGSARPYLESMILAGAFADIDTESSLSVEVPVWRNPPGYAGTPDLVCKLLTGEWCVFDWKTADKPKRLEWIRDYELQVAAYASALRNEHDIPVTQARIVIGIPDVPAAVFVLNASRLADAFREFLGRMRDYRAVVNPD